MLVFMHQQYFREAVKAEWNSGEDMVLKDRRGDVKATVVRKVDGRWLAKLESSLCAGNIEFLSVIGDSPDSAVEKLFSENIAFMVSALEEIGTISEGIDHPFDRIPVEVPAEALE